MADSGPLRGHGRWLFEQTDPVSQDQSSQDKSPQPNEKWLEYDNSAFSCHFHFPDPDPAYHLQINKVGSVKEDSLVDSAKRPGTESQVTRPEEPMEVEESDPAQQPVNKGDRLGSFLSVEVDQCDTNGVSLQESATQQVVPVCRDRPVADSAKSQHTERRVTEEHMEVDEPDPAQPVNKGDGVARSLVVPGDGSFTSGVYMQDSATASADAETKKAQLVGDHEIGERLSSDDMEVATELLREKVSPSVARQWEGGQYNATPIAAPSGQIHHTGFDHWVTSCQNADEGPVYVFDSAIPIGEPLTDLMKKQLVEVYAKGPSLRVIILFVQQQQSDTLDCGLFAIANLREWCAGGYKDLFENNTISFEFQQEQMRSHWNAMKNENEIETFPKERKETEVMQKLELKFSCNHREPCKDLRKCTEVRSQDVP